jgi:hypothetical protein
MIVKQDGVTAMMDDVLFSRVTNDWYLVYLHGDVVGELKVNGNKYFEIKYGDTTIKNIQFESVFDAKQFISNKLATSMQDDIDYTYEPYEGC